MDDSWMTQMEMPAYRTTRKFHHSRWKTIAIDPRETLSLDPQDFSDVFGGPPRTVFMSQQFSGGDRGGYNSFFSRSSFYEEIFRPQVKGSSESDGTILQENGRVLQEFNIPAEKGGRRTDRRFFSNIFGWGKEEVRRLRRLRKRSGSNSKGSSSSGLSSEDFSPLQTAAGGGFRGGDDNVEVFASRLRPINVRSRRRSIEIMQDVHKRKQEIPSFPLNHQPIYNAENEYNENFRPRNSSSEHNLYSNPKTSADDFDINSCSSAVSSICQDEEATADSKSREEEEEEEKEKDEDEVMKDFVININSDNREGTDDGIGVEEAIAWAKEMFNKHSSHEPKKCAQPQEIVKEDQLREWNKIDECELTEAEIEMDQLDENVRLWSTGKELDIRLLLSTLHHIVWPNSGWLAISIISLRENLQVKKAYQKARLCLHPDKLQQRGATLPQTHLAERAFFVLQEAWDAFISRSV